jgi:hypothetical protein
MSDRLDTVLYMDAVWPWFLLLLPMLWFARFVYRRTRPPVPRARVTVLWLLRSASFLVLMLLLAEPVLSYLARRALRPVIVTLIDTSPSMGVEEGGVTRLDRIQRAMQGKLGEHLPGPMRAFSTSVHPIDTDTLDRLRASGQATDLALALRSALTAVADPRLLAGVVMLTDGRHNLGEDPVRVAAEHGVPVYVLGVGLHQTPDDVQIVDAAFEGPAFAGRPTRLQVHLRSWGFQDSSVVVRLEEGDRVLSQTDVRLGADGQLLPLEILTPALSAGPHLLRVTVVAREGELTQHNNQSLLALRVRQNRLRILVLSGRPDPGSAFVFRTLAADSTLQIDEFFRRDAGGFYGAAPFPDGVGAYDALVLLDPADLTASVSSDDLRQYVANGGGLLLQAAATGRGGLSAQLADLLPTITEPAGAVVYDREPLRLEPDARRHPVGRGMAEGGVGRSAAGDPWQRLPPLLARTARIRAKPAATVLLAASDGDPVVVAGAFGAGRVVHVAGKGFWRQAMFGEGTGGDGRTVRAFWRAAVHWLAAAEPGGRVRASSEHPVYRSGQPATVMVEVFDELNEPLPDAEVELSLTPGGRSVTLDPQGQGRFRANLPGLEAGTHTFRVTARYGDANIGQAEGSFIVESHTVESGDLRADPEILAAIARASGGEYRELEHWAELAHVLRPLPVLVSEQQRLGVEIRHVLWLLLLTVLLTAEWILRQRSGML